jgi:hypothetical protein
MISHRDATSSAPLSASRKTAAGTATLGAMRDLATGDPATPLTDRCTLSRMNASLTFPELIASLRPLAVIFPEDEAPALTASEMIDQSVLFRQLFAGRWPHMG